MSGQKRKLSTTAVSHFWVVAWSSAFLSTVLRPVSNCTQTGTNPLYNVTAMRCSFVEVGRARRGPILFVHDRRTSGRGWTAGIPRASYAMRLSGPAAGPCEPRPRRSRGRCPEDALVANVGCRRVAVDHSQAGEGLLNEPIAVAQP